MTFFTSVPGQLPRKDPPVSYSWIVPGRLLVVTGVLGQGGLASTGGGGGIFKKTRCEFVILINTSKIYCQRGQKRYKYKYNYKS